MQESNSKKARVLQTIDRLEEVAVKAVSKHYLDSRYRSKTQGCQLPLQA